MNNEYKLTKTIYGINYTKIINNTVIGDFFISHIKYGEMIKTEVWNKYITELNLPSYFIDDFHYKFDWDKISKELFLYSIDFSRINEKHIKWVHPSRNISRYTIKFTKIFNNRLFKSTPGY